jgi:hypothetical protein
VYCAAPRRKGCEGSWDYELEAKDWIENNEEGIVVMGRRTVMDKVGVMMSVPGGGDKGL